MHQFCYTSCVCTIVSVVDMVKYVIKKDSVINTWKLPWTGLKFFTGHLSTLDYLSPYLYWKTNCGTAVGVILGNVLFCVLQDQWYRGMSL